MSKLKFYLILVLVSVIIIAGQLAPPKANAAYDLNLIMSDSQFTASNTLSAAQINAFLVAKGSVYANYTIPQNVTVPYPYAGGNWGTVSVEQVNSGSGEVLYGKTVAQLIYDECQSHHINPQVILAIMQKESSVIEQSSVSSTRQAWPLFYAFNETMASFGYDQGTAQNVAINYGGVGQQLAYATWNFGDKYTKWGNGTLGNWRSTMNIDGTAVYPQSICTRLLYTYTPHSWQSFLTVLSRWGWTVLTYSYSFVSQSAYPAVQRGSAATMTLVLRNTGTATWRDSTVHLGTSRPQDRYLGFNYGSGWVSFNRVGMQEAAVAPGENGTFTFSVVPSSGMSPGTYREYFRPVADTANGGWMRDIGIYWDVRVLPPPTITDVYKYSLVSQSAYPTVTRGARTTLTLKIRNAGTATWRRSFLHLGTNRPQDRYLGFNYGSGWASPNRALMQEAAVAPGEIATFSFDITPSSGMSPGTYREYFQPVADGYTWMRDIGIYWDVRVR